MTLWTVGDNLRERIGEEATENRLRYHSLTFIRTLKNLKGAAITEEVVEAISGILGWEWSGQIVADLLADTADSTESRMYITTGKLDEKIPLIKGVRAISGMGLKDSKDAVDQYCERMIVWQNDQAKQRPNYNGFGWYDTLSAPYLDIPIWNRRNEDGSFDDAWFQNSFMELRKAGWKVIA